MPRRPVLITILVAAAVLSACSSNGSSDSSKGGGASRADKPIEMCSLITADQAQAALGEPVDAPRASDTPVPSCSWPATNGNGAKGVVIQKQATFVFDGTLKAGATSGFTIEPIAGLGDAAFFQSSDPSGSDLLLGFKKNGTAIYVSVNSATLSPQQVKAAELQIATEAANKL